MIRRGLLAVALRLNGYGYGLGRLSPLAGHLLPTHVKPTTLAVLKEKFMELVPTYMGALRSEVNPHFRTLLARRKVLKMGTVPYLFGIYTAHATRALWLAVDVIYSAIRTNKRVLFISDKDTEAQLGIQSLNCMLYGPYLHSSIEELSQITFYYTSQIRTLVPLGQVPGRYFDLVVVCLSDYSRINRTTFQSVSRFTLGTCSQHTRPDLFDYYVPAMGSYHTSVQLLRDVAILAYLSR